MSPPVLPKAAVPAILAFVPRAVAELTPRASWWYEPRTGDTPETLPSHGTHGIMIRCGACSFTGRLSDSLDSPMREDGTHGHAIAADGAVTPSILCPECGWHIWATLAEWAVDHIEITGEPITAAAVIAPPAGTRLAPLPRALSPQGSSARMNTTAPVPGEPFYKCSQCGFTCAELPDHKSHPHLASGIGNCPFCMKGHLALRPASAAKA